jgi:hypothetical protein
LVQKFPVDVIEKLLASHLITLFQKLEYVQGELESSGETTVFLGMPTDFRIDVQGSLNMAVNYGYEDHIITKHNRSLKVAVQGPDFWPTPSTYVM